jgi:hypothetical protein
MDRELKVTYRATRSANGAIAGKLTYYLNGAEIVSGDPMFMNPAYVISLIERHGRISRPAAQFLFQNAEAAEGA